jgi:anthranilate synthase component 1
MMNTMHHPLCITAPDAEDAFKRLAAEGFNRIPVTLETLADLETPLSLYLKLANAPYTFLFESVQGGERFGRYSFIGLPSNTRLSIHGYQLTRLHNGEIVESRQSADPLADIAAYQASFKVPHQPALPRFCGGLVGIFGYDTVRYIEPRLAQTEAKAPHPDPIGTPDILLMLVETLAIVDNLSGKLTLVHYADPSQPNAFASARELLESLQQRLHTPAVAPEVAPTAAKAQEPVSLFGEASFKAAVLKAKDYITEGDIMQVVLSQRMQKPFRAHPLSLYRSLRALNPSPYMFYVDAGDFHVVGSSPEILVRLETDVQGGAPKITLRPIAGTRPRGATSEADAALAAELLADEKECAEHTQLLDLGRNDVGRVAQTGSVKLTDRMVIERYSHVMHIVSNVEGALKPNLSALDVLKATFPAGTVSGAPKVRAMEIIDELEPVKRGVYAGSVGYLGFSGDMDLAIAIRTAVIKDGVLNVQAGAGIVADSNPDAEWTETQNKARAVIRAAELAESGLVPKIDVAH